MARDTFLNLNEEKQDRIFKALIKEFGENPLEKASIKNIINIAEIPRGSFYQYFYDKEEALKYVITKIANQNKDEALDKFNLEEINLYSLIEFIYVREINYLKQEEASLRMKILAQIMKSPRATDIFNETITESLIESDIFQKTIENSELAQLSKEEYSAILELLISILKEALYTVFQDKTSTEEVSKKLKIKLQLIKAGIKESFS